MSRHLNAVFVAAALAGCALPGRPVAGIAAGDLATAQAIAKAGGDARGATCWGNLLPAVQALGNAIPASVQEPQLATALEVYRVAMIQAQGVCAPIVMPLIAHLGPLLTAGALALGPVSIP